MKLQKGYKMDERIHKWIADNCQRAGYHYPSQFLAHIVEDAMKSDKYRIFSNKKIENELEIGEIAKISKGTKFSVVRATKDLKEDIDGFKESHRYGLISREQCEMLSEKSRANHKKVAQLHLSNMRIDEIRKKLKEQESKGKQ